MPRGLRFEADSIACDLRGWWFRSAWRSPASGVYQHYVWYPQTAEQYRNKRDQLDKLLQARSAGGTEADRQNRQRRIAELGGWLTRHGIPLDGPARKQWEDRVLNSSEPMGTFALANTLAGLLAAVLFPALAFLVQALRNRIHPFAILAALVCVVLLGLCLILTKSRTAWVGCIGGGIVWWTFSGRRVRVDRKWILTAFGVAAAVVVGVTAVAFTGGLDAAVASQAPKSLRYRAQYWTGTVGVLKDEPLFGPGPGNFRQHYLRHKLPESSEEIRDPHNLFLDVWCSGGLAALAGLLILICAVAMNAFSRPAVPTEENSTEDRSPGVARWYTGAIAGFVLVMAMKWFLGIGEASRDGALLCGTILVMAALGTMSRFRLGLAPLMAGLAALLVHLCGAGGIEMPAITQLIIVLAALIPGGKLRGVLSADSELEPLRLGAAFGGSALCAMLFGACLSWGMIPVITRVASVSDGRVGWQVEGRFEHAERRFERAAVNDPLSPDPPEQLAQLFYARWRRSTPVGKDNLVTAIRTQRIAIQLDPHNFRRHQLLGRWLVDLYEADTRPVHINRAVAAYDEATALYPHNAVLLSEHATALSLAGRPKQATEAARRALEQDDINHREGHTDKFLAEKVRTELKALTRED